MCFAQIALSLLLILVAPAKAPVRSVNFEHDVRPILEQHCQPCHFQGGKMYAHLPFDKAATIDKLGTRLFTRIRKEDEQKVIRAYLAR